MLPLIIIISLILIAIITVLQGKRVKQSAIRLPEASGTRVDILGKQHSLLHIGESTVAGVGVSDIEEGLTVQIVREMANRFNHELGWEIIGMNGAKANDLLSGSPLLKTPDILLISTGVNDTTGLTTSTDWLESIQKCVAKYAANNTEVYFTSVPPMHKFPLLPQPLRTVLGLRALWLDRLLKNLCKQKGWTYIENTLETREEFMAIDGYHPCSTGYHHWATIIAKKIAEKAMILQKPSINA